MISEILHRSELEGKEKKRSYGKYVLVFVLLAGIFNSLKQGIPSHSLSPIFAFLITVLQIFFDLGVLYFLVLWIVYLRRGGVERPENRRIKLSINSIFGILLLWAIISFTIDISESPSEESPAEQVAIQNLLKKQQETVDFNDEMKVASLKFVDVLNHQEWQKMPTTLQDLLNTAKTFQLKLDEYKSLIQESSSFLSNKDRTAFAFSIKMLDIRDRHNRKLVDIAKFGLTIDWNNPDEIKSEQLMVMIRDLSSIEKEMQDAQVGL